MDIWRLVAAQTFLFSDREMEQVFLKRNLTGNANIRYSKVR